jgi:hypothetical protein
MAFFPSQEQLLEVAVQNQVASVGSGESKKCEVQIDPDLADVKDMRGFSSCQKAGLMCLTVPHIARAEARPSLSV